jgi:hypothetical protein
MKLESGVVVLLWYMDRTLSICCYLNIKSIQFTTFRRLAWSLSSVKNVSTLWDGR